MSDATETLTIRPPVGKVLRLPFALRGPALEYPLATRVLRYWDEVRGPRSAPARSEIDPRHLAEALEFTFIAEFVTPDIARLRIAGRQFEDLLGMDPRGMPLGVYFSLDAREELAMALAQVSQGARAQLPLRGESGLGKPGLDGLLLLLPLTDGAGQITRVLGVLETHGQIGRTPRRFKLAGQKMQITPSAPEPAQARPAPTRAGVETTPPVSSQSVSPKSVSSQSVSPRPAPGTRARLRLIKGGRA